MHLGYGSEADDLVDVFIYQFSYFSRSKRIEIASCNPDLHFLDACRRALLPERGSLGTSVHSSCNFAFGWLNWTCKFQWLRTPREKDNFNLKQLVRCFRSASDLKAKGIHFRPSRDYSLTGLHFKSGYCYRQLQLPILHVSTHTKIFFSNLIAYESCLDPTERKVTAYIKFMKSLVVQADDVKELREKGILFNSLGSDEEVVKMFKELSTSTLSNEKAVAFEDVSVQIQKHFCNKFKPRLGKFLYTYFRSPWTAFGTIAAAILLLLTLAQTYFTIWDS